MYRFALWLVPMVEKCPRQKFLLGDRLKATALARTAAFGHRTRWRTRSGTSTSHGREPRCSGLADLHVKSAISGDIDDDGDVDLWVESTGGANVSSHFMVNNGDGTFTLDTARPP